MVAAPVFTCHMLVSLADGLACIGRAPTGLICCILCIMPKCESSLYVDPIKAKLPGIVALHQAAFAAAGVESFLLRSTPSSRMRARTTRSRLFIYFCNFYSITERR